MKDAVDAITSQRESRRDAPRPAANFENAWTRHAQTGDLLGEELNILGDYVVFDVIPLGERGIGIDLWHPLAPSLVRSVLATL